MVGAVVLIITAGCSTPTVPDAQRSVSAGMTIRVIAPIEIPAGVGSVALSTDRMQPGARYAPAHYRCELLLHGPRTQPSTIDAGTFTIMRTRTTADPIGLNLFRLTTRLDLSSATQTVVTGLSCSRSADGGFFAPIRVGELQAAVGRHMAVER